MKINQYTTVLTPEFFQRTNFFGIYHNPFCARDAHVSQSGTSVESKRDHITSSCGVPGSMINKRRRSDATKRARGAPAER